MSRIGRLLFLLAPAALALPVAAQTTYPGAAPCDTTLQACIDAASSGDIIQIATNTPIDETILIEISLTLRPAPGFTPTIGTGIGNTFRRVQVQTDVEDGMTVVVEGLNIDHGSAEAFMFNGTGHSVTFQDLTVLNAQDSNNTRGIEVDFRTPGSTALIQRNNVISNGQPISVFAMLPAGGAPPTATFTVLANILTSFEQSNSNDGIEVDIRGVGEVTAFLWSNVIYGTTGCNCGGASGIKIDTQDDVTANVFVTNNTVDDSQVASDGLSALARENSTLNLTVYNNIISNSTQAAVDVGTTAPTATVNVQNDFNSFVGNADPNNWNGGTDGPSSGDFDPNYIDPAAGNYMPGMISSVIDMGFPTPPGGLPPVDANNGPRVVGAGPDMGAIEGAPGSTRPAIPTASTFGLVLLALLLAGVAVRRLAR